MSKYEDFNDASFLNDAEAAQEWWDSLTEDWKIVLAKQAACEVEKPNFEEIGYISKLKCPNLKATNFTPIINLSRISAISCYSSPTLTNIASLADLNALICNDSVNLVSISKLSNLTLLNCSGCTSLSNILKLPSLTFLNFSNCPNLQKFGFLHNLFDLQTLNCSNCKTIEDKDLEPVYNQSLLLKELHCKGSRAIGLKLKNRFRDRGCKVFD
jgi:hypothetical protein